MDKIKVVVVVSHPIQHFCPQYVSFSQHPAISLKVFFGSALGYKPYLDRNFKKEISWGNLNLEKFDHIFLNGEEVIPVTKSIDAPSLDEALKEFGPDLVITYGYFQKLQRRAYRWAKKNKIPLAYISDSELKQQRGFFNKLLRYPFLSWYFSSIDFFLTVGNANEDYYKNYNVPVRKFIRMHFPIDVEQYKQSFDQKELFNTTIREKYNIGSDEIVLSVVGKLVPWKNQDHIIDAMILLEKQGVYITLFILGSGEKMEEWAMKAQALKKSKVYFPGFINIETLPHYYAATNIYVHPASVEPHSIAISEAIYMGCPVIISSRCGSYGAEDDVQEGKNGHVFEFGNIETLSLLIRNLAEDKEKRKSFGAYSHQLGLTFQYQSHVGVVENICSRLKTVF